MEWAKDYRGNIIQARRGVYLGYHLTCPTCGEPVYLRAGKARRPHFAHYSNRAKPDCEYYYPSPDAFQRATTHEPNHSLYPKRDSLRCGLFLALRPEPIGFELFLRIPSLADTGTLDGSLEVEHGSGTKTFTAKQLIRAQTVPLSPTVPLLECTGTEGLLPLSSHIMSQTDQFAQGMNLFASSEMGGRFLFAGEPLEWGVSYWILSKEAVTLPDDVGTHIELKRRGSVATWRVYEMTLPATLIATRTDVGSIISAFFGRRIRPCQPRAYIVYPSPHHFAVDGALIYPFAPKMLYVRRTNNHDVTVEGPQALVDEVVITGLTDDWVRITGIKLSSHDVAILVNGIEQIVLRIEECDLIQPNGIRVCVGDICWDALTDTPLTSAELFSNAISVECSNVRLAQYVARINNGWILEGSTLSLPENTDKTLNTRGFGAIRVENDRVVDNHDSDESLVGTLQLPMATWIEGLVRLRHGLRMATHVREYIANPNYGNLNKLGPLITSTFMAYITAAINQRDNSE